MNGNLRDTRSTDANRPRLATWRRIAHASPGRALLWAVVAIGAVAALFVVRAIDPADSADGHFYPFCVFHRLTGLHCPGCGTLRDASIAARESRGALRMNVLSVCLLPIMFVVFVRNAIGAWRGIPVVLATAALGAGRLALGGCDSDRRVWYPTEPAGVAVHALGAALIVAGSLRVPSAAATKKPKLVLTSGCGTRSVPTTLRTGRERFPL